MALQASERTSMMAAAGAAGLPALFEVSGVDQVIVDVADSLFEGDRQAAKMAVAGFYGVVGLAGIAAGWFGPLNGDQGQAALVVGVGFLALAILTYFEG